MKFKNPSLIFVWKEGRTDKRKKQYAFNFFKIGDIKKQAKFPSM